MDTRWVLKWKMAGGGGTAEARLVAKSIQAPDLKDGVADTSGCLSLRSPHLQVLSLSALKKLKLRSLDIKNACLQADGFAEDVFPHDSPEWGPYTSCRSRKLNAPAYSRNDAPVASHCSLQRHLVKSDLSLARKRWQYAVSSFDPRPYFVFRKGGGAVSACATHNDDILCCGAPGVLERAKNIPGTHFGELELQESSFVHVGMELSEE